MVDHSSNELLRDFERLASIVTSTKAALTGSLVPLGVTVDEVEADLRSYVRALKAEGQPPEQAVIAVKAMLGERTIPLGLAAQAAFEQARHNATLAEAIVTLAIVIYFETIPLFARDADDA